MRLNINLATQPYEDARRFYTQWATGLAVLALVTVALVTLAVSAARSSESVSRQAGQLHKQIAGLDEEKAAAAAILNQPEHRETRDRSRFLNALIARKTFSWSQVFADLEKLIPARVRVVSIRPEVTAANQLEIHMEAIGDSREKAVELVRRMEESQTFREPQVRAEKSEAQGAKSGVQFEIVAVYVPPARKGSP